MHIMKSYDVSFSWLLLLSAVGFTFPMKSASIAVVNPGDDWLYRKGVSAPQADWRTAEATNLDHTWLGPAPGGFGYGDGDDATVLSLWKFLTSIKMA